MVIAYKFQHKFGAEHINVLELRAKLSAVKWRARKAANLGTKYVHLLDSQVNLGVLAKGRSSSQQLANVMEQICAVLLASRMIPVGGYTRTDDNPADEPSRRWVNIYIYI